MPSISIPTALAVGVGGITSLASGAMASSAAKKAAKVQADAATLAANNQMDMFNKTQANLKPYMDAGTGALGMANNLLGLGPHGFDADLIQKTLESTPGYQFTRDQGLKSVQNSYAAKGLASSGAALKGAADYTTGLANMTYEQRLANYMNMAAQGQNAAAGLGTFGANAAHQAGEYTTGGAAATAGGIVGSTNALTQGLSGFSGSLLTNSLLQGMYGSGTPAGSGGSGAPVAAGTALNPGVH